MNRLKELRQEKKLTQQELADMIGTTKLTVSNWENDKHVIKSDKAQALADYFGVSVGYLLGYSNANSAYLETLINWLDTKIELNNRLIQYSKPGFEIFLQSDNTMMEKIKAVLNEQIT